MNNCELIDHPNFHSGEENNYCPECGSSNLFDLDTKFECDDCGYIWIK
jgi:rubredoxin